jgi:predicted transcriptional regulator
LFQRACEALWGSRYRSDGARALGVSLRTMMRYDAGESPIPDEITGKLADLLDERNDQIEKIAARMSRM